MKGTKLCAYLCALLVIHSGSADHDVDHAPLNSASPSVVSTEASPAASVSGSNLDSISPHFNSSGIEGLTSNATADEETTTMMSEQVDDYGKSVKLTNESRSELPVVTTDSHSSPSRPPAIISTTDVAHTSSADPPHTPTPLPEYSTSHNDTPSLPDATIPLGNQTGNESQTVLPTSHPAPETSTAPSGNQSNSTSGFIPPQEPSSSSPPDIHPGTTEEARPRFSTTLSNSPSSQAKTHVDNPSQLNVGGDPTVRHDSPTLDPLLAGLVSAFIITAVIITLLLFFKLRQRDNRPEFRRLQDLPMDDMMEDTPLSMYSY